MDLANIMEKSSGHDQITIDLRIIPAHQVAQRKQRDHVIQQSADERVMQRLGGRGIFVRALDLRIAHESLKQRSEVWVGESCDEVADRLPELVNIFRSLGKIVGVLN